MGRVYLENIQIEQRLRKAIDDGEIHMVYQPQFDCGGASLGLGVEALARWDDRELGKVGPSRYVAIAETSGVIGKLGDRIMVCCLEDARRIAGHRIALDDLGTGFSSLSMLRKLPIDELKIDKIFVDDLETRNSSRKFVQSILAIAVNHDIGVIFDGAETKRQFEILRENG